MKTKALISMAGAALAFSVLATTGCDRKSRANPADERYRAATPAEGGATSTEGSAGDRKNFGDTRTKTEADGQSPSASPTGLSKDTPRTPQAQAEAEAQAKAKAQSQTPTSTTGASAGAPPKK